MKRKFLIKRIARNVQMDNMDLREYGHVKKCTRMKIHVFATILALFPFTRTEDIAKEFGISVGTVKHMAKVCRVKKDESFRSEINRRNGQIYARKAAKRRKRREKRAVKLWNEGASREEIAMKMRISKYTVYKYLKSTNNNQ